MGDDEHAHTHAPKADVTGNTTGGSTDSIWIPPTTTTTISWIPQTCCCGHAVGCHENGKCLHCDCKQYHTAPPPFVPWTSPSWPWPWPWTLPWTTSSYPVWKSSTTTTGGTRRTPAS